MCTIVRRRRLGMSSVRGIAEFSKTGIKWVRNDKLPLPLDNLYIRWGCTADVPAQKVLNTAAAIHEVNDKASFRVKLSDAELSPHSIENGKIWGDEDLELFDFDYPLIVRPNKHAQGRKLYKCNTPDELSTAFKKCGEDGYTSEFIDKVKEYRVAVVQGRWNDWPLKAVRIAIEAFNLSSLDFGGVDIMVDKDGEAYVLEINSAPSLTSPYRQEAFAKAFDWIVEHDKERIPLIKKLGGYLKFIHPALTDKAKLV